MGLRKALGLGNASDQHRARSKRAAQKLSMPRLELTRDHTQGCVVLPSRSALIAELPRGGVVGEIGVASGDFSQEILNIAKPARLHLVDSWESARYGEGFAATRARFSNEIASGQVVANRGLSVEVLKTFDDHYFDWVYIDTDHSYKTTAAELRICRQKVRAGGHIAGHDFCPGNVIAPVAYGVVEACLEFCEVNRWKFEYLALAPDGHFSYCLRAMNA